MVDFELGIDDAGRGPVIGPMVLAGCLIDKKTEVEFKKLGVRDSKQLTQKRREYLANIVREKAETFEVVLSYPNEIDHSLGNGTNLNALEAIKTAEIINKINKGYKKIRVIVDCPSVSTVRWCDLLKTKIDNPETVDVKCEHKADKNHVSVSAASILAKSTREKEMDKLREKYGTGIGSGYTSDPATQKFLQKHAHKYHDHGIFRKTWETWRKVIKTIGQRKLF
ncbi:MAG: ribonuclease HII [Candidatus Nanoarchaeia archaeon]